MKQLIIVLVLLGISSAIYLVPEPKNDLCLETGPQCSTNCEKIILCPNRNGEPMDIVTCEDKVFCETTLGYPNCSASSCGNEPFRCTAPGAIPDPYNSSSFYLCPGINTSGIKRDCEFQTFFNTSTQRCSENQETYSPIICSTPGQPGEIGNDNAFCYTCDDHKIPLVYFCNLKSDS